MAAQDEISELRKKLAEEQKELLARRKADNVGDSRVSFSDSSKELSKKKKNKAYEIDEEDEEYVPRRTSKSDAKWLASAVILLISGLILFVIVISNVMITYFESHNETSTFNETIINVSMNETEHSDPNWNKTNLNPIYVGGDIQQEETEELEEVMLNESTSGGGVIEEVHLLPETNRDALSNFVVSLFDNYAGLPLVVWIISMAFIWNIFFKRRRSWL